MTDLLAITSPIVSTAQFASTVLSKTEAYGLLQSEVATAKRLSWHTRHLVENTIKHDNLPPSCLLEVVVAATNAVDDFINSKTQGTKNELLMRTSPEWYREQTNRLVSNLQTELLCYQMEVQTYTNAILNQMLVKPQKPPMSLSTLLNSVIAAVQVQSEECKWFYEGFLRQSTTAEKPTVCPTCLRPTFNTSPAIVGTPTITETFVSQQQK